MRCTASRTLARKNTRTRRLDLEDGPAAVGDDEKREALREVISNSKLSEHFLALARDLDVVEAKVPEDVYKTHLVGSCGGVCIDTWRWRLAWTWWRPRCLKMCTRRTW